MKIQISLENLNNTEKMRIIKNITEEKIRILEDKISQSDNIEDIKQRENKIKKLQESLAEIRNQLTGFNKLDNQIFI